MVGKGSIYPFCDDAWLLWFCNQSQRLEQINYRITEVRFLIKFLNIRLGLSKNCNFQIMSFCPFSDASWMPCFSTNQYVLNILCRGSPKEHFYQIILESDKQIQRRRFLKFEHFAHFLMPQQPKFSMEFKSLNNFERGPPMEHSCEVWMKLVMWFRIWCSKKEISSFCPFSDAALMPCFSTN